ncbi:MAG TPA: zinc ABC transporter substrate-binding protein [Streptosporangiaceae bacterium]
MRVRRAITLTIAAAAAATFCAACSTSSAASTTGPVTAIGAENEYADVIAQIGGKYVNVSSIESNPNTDPHTFEASPSIAGKIASAQLVVQNGLDYDTYMSRLENASPNSARQVIDVQQLLGLPATTPNPHLWYKPSTMPAVAKAVADDLAKLRPSHAAYFQANVTKFDHSLQPWLTAMAQFKAAYSGTPVAVTEPVGDYMLQAAGADIVTPFGLQADIMNGVDPSAQYVSQQENLFREHKVKVFLYNQQVTDSLTVTFLALAHRYGIPVVGVYETMPTPGFTYQSWMLAEVNALHKAVADKVSTQKL